MSGAPVMHPLRVAGNDGGDLRLAGTRSGEPGALTIEDVIDVARYRRRVSLEETARNSIRRARGIVEELIASDAKVYGLTTGFGKLRDIKINKHEREKLQEHLIRSHAAGMGPPLPEPIVRAAILLRANTLAQGHSGVRVELVEQLLNMLNDGVYPLIPTYGSVGASGDLAPLSHLALVLMGDPGGRVHARAHEGDAAAAMAVHPDARESDFISVTEGTLPWNARPDPTKFQPIKLLAKEGLALNNGTPFMSAFACFAVYDSYFLLRAAESAGAMSLEACQGVLAAYERQIHDARPLPGQGESASRVRALCQGSDILGHGNVPEVNEARPTGFPIVSAHLKRAVTRLGEAGEHLDRVVKELAKEDEEEPWPVHQLKVRLKQVETSLGEILSPNDESALRRRIRELVTAKSEPDRLKRADAILAPARREVTALLREVQSATFPEGPESRAKLEKALVQATKSVVDAVPDHPHVQDDYSLRCFPQVIGGAWRALSHVHDVIRVEICSATDNPLIFPDLDPKDASRCVLSGGNFHGQPIATAMDYLSIAMAEVGSIAERRVAHLVDEGLSRGIPAFLIESNGLNSGFMIPQYTAAALVSENKVLCHPASVDSIPTCANTEDHVSMGLIAARKANTVIENVRRVVAIELLAASQGVHFRAPLRPGRRLCLLLDMVTRQVQPHIPKPKLFPIQDDVVMTPLLNATNELIASPAFCAWLLSNQE